MTNQSRVVFAANVENIITLCIFAAVDFRALCAELAEFVARLTKHYYQPAELLTRARAALADEPAVPEGREPASVTGQPSDEALYDYWISTSPEFGCADPVGFARAVLARWGTPNLAETRSSLGDAPQPVPVSERWPKTEDCDGEGRCWWFHDEDGASCSHWLPAHTLPVPGEVTS